MTAPVQLSFDTLLARFPHHADRAHRIAVIDAVLAQMAAAWQQGARFVHWDDGSAHETYCGALACSSVGFAELLLQSERRCLVAGTRRIDDRRAG